MNRFLVFMPGGLDRINAEYPENFMLDDNRLWAIASNEVTPHDVCKTLNIFRRRCWCGDANYGLPRTLRYGALAEARRLGNAIMSTGDKVVQHPAQGTPNPGYPRGGPPNGGTGERLARLETELQHVAKKKDMSDLKTDLVKAIGDGRVTMLMWQIGILVTAVLVSCLGVASLVVKIMMPGPAS
ncbi:MAG: hypothetical protein OXC14_12425 [Rhodospirillaceae bacterium]|nr:hypothetical protein [Rhodospirillaceae bacterium]